MKTFLSYVLSAVSMSSVLADTYYLKTGDGSGTSSFTGKGSCGGWELADGTGDHNAPTAGNDYVVNDLGLRTPNESKAYTFAGNSLTLHTDLSASPISWATLITKHTGGTSKPMTIPNFVLENGLVAISNTKDSSHPSETIAGNVTIAEGYYGFLGNSIRVNSSGDEMDNRYMNLQAAFKGAGTAVFVFRSKNVLVYLDGDNSAFTGKVFVGCDGTYATREGGAKGNGRLVLNDTEGATWFGDMASFTPEGLTVRNGSEIVFKANGENTANRGVTILDAPAVFRVDENYTVKMSAPITSEFGFTKTNPGTLVLAGDNSDLEAGSSVTVSGGTVKALNANAFGAATVSFAEGTTLALDAATGPVAFASLPDGLANVSLTGDSLADDTTKIDLFTYPAGTTIDLDSIVLTPDLPDGIDTSKMVLQAVETDEQVMVSYVKPDGAVPKVDVSLASLAAESVVFTLNLGYYDDTITDPLTVKAYCSLSDHGMTAEGWGDPVASWSLVPGKHDLTVGVPSGALGYVIFSVQSTGGGEPVWTATERVNTSPIMVTLDATIVHENDPNGVTLRVSRPVESASLPLTVTLAYEGSAVDSFVADSLPATLEFGAGVGEVRQTLLLVDNAEADGDRGLTVSAVASTDYVVGSTSSAELTVKDDESLAAADCVWTGAAGDGLWETPGNWSDNKVPTLLDTAIFPNDNSVSAGAKITVSSVAKAAKLLIQTPAAFSLVAATDDAALQTTGIVRSDFEETTEGNVGFYVKLVLAPDSTGDFVCDIAGSGTVSTFSNIVKSASCNVSGASALAFRKTGDGNFDLATEGISYRGPWEIDAGTLTASKENSIAGNVTIGGGEERADLKLPVDNALTSYPDNSPTSFTVLTNGVVRTDKLIGSGRLKKINAHDNADVKLTHAYSYQIYMHGATVDGAYYGGGSGQAVAANQTDKMSTFSGVFNAGGSTLYMRVDEGAAPVDLLVTGAINNGSTSQKLQKSGEGVLKTLSNWGNLKSKCEVLAGAWYVDNPGTYGQGIQTTTVSKGATLGGTGHIGMKDKKDSATLTLNGGSADTFATLAPGTIDNETGKHVYGTFTVAYANIRNSVSLGNYSRLEIGLGPRDADGKPQSDKLKVYGPLKIGSNCVLDLAANSCDPKQVKGGVYTLVEADSIEGSFASVVLPEGCRGWKVSTVNAVAPGDGPDGEDVNVVRIVGEVLNGFSIFVR